MNQVKSALLSLALLPIVAFTSCTHDAYVLNAPNPSLFTEKGEKKLSFHASPKSIQPQWAMSVTDKYSYQVNSHVGFLGQSYLEGLGGLYKSNNWFRMEVYSGLGFGYLNYSNSTHTEFTFLNGAESANVYSNYLKVPLQLNLGFQNKKGATFFLVHRMSWVHFFQLDYEYYQGIDKRRDGYLSTTQTASVQDLDGFIWELGIGFKHKNFLFQAGSSIQNIKIPAYVEEHNSMHKATASNFEEIPLEYVPVYLIVGYTFDFKKKKSPFKE